MKLLTTTLFLTLISFNAFATTASGRIQVITNDDESMMIVKGAAARDLYNRLDVKAVNGEKRGRDLSCTLTGEDVFECSMKLQESDITGAKFTGVVGE
jgi:hypothetical protein